MEEEVFYPALRNSGNERAQARIAESYEEHRLQDALITELLAMPAGNEQFAAKFTVLMATGELHMQEEEHATLPQAERLLEDQLTRLGREMAARRDQVLAAVR
jgi:iron-sulfur cluster repair protein YtfE (RIC family)